MTITKFVSGLLLSTCAALVWNATQAMPLEHVNISPGSGIYLSSSNVELTIVVRDPAPIEHIEYYLNDKNVNSWFQSCMSEGRTLEGFTYLTCKAQPAAMFGVGPVRLDVMVHTRGGGGHASAEYLILPTAPEEVVKVTLPAAERDFPVGLELDPNYRYEFRATGKVVLWPDNTMSLPASPDGNARTCNNSDCMMPYKPAGMLVGRVNGRGIFPLGSRFTLENQSGQLFLSVNDHDFSDNVGAFEIEVKKFAR